MQKLIADLQSGVDNYGLASQQLIGDESLLEGGLGDNPWFESHAQTTLQHYASALGFAAAVRGASLHARRRTCPTRFRILCPA
jgi:hypothetical protein